MTDKVFPGGRGLKKIYGDTTVRVPRDLAPVLKYICNAYRWQLRQGVDPEDLRLWVEDLKRLIYNSIDSQFNLNTKTPGAKARFEKPID